MILLQPIEFPGIDRVLNDIDYYKDRFVSDSVLCFRNANLTKEEQFDFGAKIGKLMGWNYLNDTSEYLENHIRKADIVSGPDDIIVEWHVEHTYYVNPIVASTWNMYNFKTNPENGKTYFVDTGVVFEMLSDDEKQFLLDSVVTEPDFIKESQLKSGFLSGETNLSEQHPIIAKHWLTEKPIIRFMILPEPFMVILVRYKNQIPSEDDLQYFKTLIRKIEKIITENEDIRIVHKWQQGDLVIPDLFKLAHAVTGGFKSEDREFRGIWGYKNIVL